MVRLLQTPLATATTLLLALAGSSTRVAPSHALSISSPTRDYDASDRAAAIAEAASQVVNGPRNMTIGGETFPLFYGPLLPPGSAMDQLEHKEDARVDELGSELPKLFLGLAANLSAELTSFDGYRKLYNALGEYVEWPMSSDNRDETFGEQRLTVKSSALRKATLDDLGDDTLALPEHRLLEICGRDAEQLYDDGLLFVEDYHDAATYNDPKRPDKYVPSVVGFFCATPDTLLPIEIRLLDTNVTYTPADSEAEWTLAKMALEVGSATYHQWQHLVETHAVLIPLRVEAMRTMSADHPVRALLQRHSQVDFGLEYRTVHHLLAENESLAQIIGWGASGSARFALAQFARGASVQHKEFHADVARRGLAKIRGHKYVQYGTLYEKAIRAFVAAFVDVYYARGDAAVADDLELQHWAAASARIPHVPDFPTAIDTKDQLRRLLTHLVFTSTVRHHSMSGQVTWHGHSPPFAPAALWKPLPTAKLAAGESLDVLAYAAPPKVVPLAVAVTTVFYRNVTEEQSILSAYKVEPFASEAALQPAIAEFGKALDHIEQTIATNEADCEWPYRALLPSNMPHHSWI